MAMAMHKYIILVFSTKTGASFTVFLHRYLNNILLSFTDLFKCPRVENSFYNFADKRNDQVVIRSFFLRCDNKNILSSIYIILRSVQSINISNIQRIVIFTELFLSLLCSNFHDISLPLLQHRNTQETLTVLDRLDLDTDKPNDEELAKRFGYEEDFYAGTWILDRIYYRI